MMMIMMMIVMIILMIIMIMIMMMISPHAYCRHMILCALNVLFCIYAKLMLFTLARRHPDCTRSSISA